MVATEDAEDYEKILASQNADRYAREGALQEAQLDYYDRDRKDEFNKWLLDTDKEIMNLKMSLLGYIYDRQTDDYVKLSSPSINENGANELITFLIAHINKATMSSSMEKRELDDLIFDIEETLILDLYYHVHDWEITSSNIQKIRTMTINFIKFALKKSQDGFMIENLNKMVRLHETTHRIDKAKQTTFNTLGQMAR